MKIYGLQNRAHCYETACGYRDFELAKAPWPVLEILLAFAPIR